MKPDLGDSLVQFFVAYWWTPIFVLLFLAVVAYAVWPRNKKAFDDAAKLPLRED
ncbi:Cbb3-type cytochrome oxidase component [Rhodovulum sp. PH10]|uniref:cbb3-type cytochrome oxidase subunit 3 n=1 Tax=Rhodovulum sp. PH10 TaxID=1187851 RepID=UPI00027C1F17|nr:cbb3-type cytochrome c oxidase subunit 3 [Rhodovulum sp. PH10]EJW09626.1 Cbb3-type cytochrome oxidase component [Rhodovulum sp. PH10]